MTKPSGTGRPRPRIRMSPEPFPPQRARTFTDPTSSENPYTNLPVLACVISPPIRRSSSGAFMISSFPPPPSQIWSRNGRENPALQFGDDFLGSGDRWSAHAQFNDAQLDEFGDHVGFPSRLAAHADPDSRLPRRF